MLYEVITKLVENLVNRQPDEKVRSIIKVKDFSEDRELMFFTKNGMVKKTNLSLFQNINRSGLRAISVKDGDDIINVGLISETEKEVLIATKEGYSIRFSHDTVRPMSYNFV